MCLFIVQKKNKIVSVQVSHNIILFLEFNGNAFSFIDSIT